MLQQQRDVLAPVAERRRVDPDDVQAMVQILAESTLFHGLSEILVGRRDHADVDTDRALPADPVELPLREHAQQTRL